MTTTVFVDKQTVIEATWLNDVNSITYNGTTPTNVTATQGQTAVTVGTYVPGGHLMVFRNGLLQKLTDDYAETNTTTITFVSPGLSVGDVITARKHPV